MNFRCNLVEIEEDTPTYVTYLLLDYQEDGNPCGGHSAVARRYITWLQYRRQEMFNAAAADARQQEYIDAEYSGYIREIEAVRDHEDLEFFAI